MYMLLGESSIHDGDVAAAVAAPEDGAGPEPDSGGEEEAGRTRFGRWPREETFSLIKIRSEMDVAFRESSAKGPLWEEVSRKLAGLGYHRSGKKCREKFENVYKYHKRTKDGRPANTAVTLPSGKSKTYRFFDQLEALEANPTVASLVTLPTVMQNFQFNNFSSPMMTPIGIPSYLPAADTTSSSTYSDRDVQRQHGPGSSSRRRRRKKRKWMELLEKLMGEVARKQEELQKNLLDVMERRERKRLIREEAWRAQEAARINHECEMMARDRSAAAAKDNAVISFLQGIVDQKQKVSRDNLSSLPAGVWISNVESERRVDNGEKASGSSSRWPRAEIEALIQLRTNSMTNYGENATKGPLWEDISSAMKNLGYNRNPKRCKEKWENINKYFKKVKESNKKRRQDSKTCPYFQLLDEIYKQKKVGKNNNDTDFFLDSNHNNLGGSFSAATPPLMVTPEQQWPPMVPPRPTSKQEFGVGDTDGEGDGDGDYDDEDEDGEEQFEVVAIKV